MRIFLIPKDNVTVIDPETGTPLDADGEYKEDAAYWRRRVLDGDVTIEEEGGEEP